MTLSEELKWRGFFNQTTFKDISELDKAPRSFYWGCDPSSDSLTIGNLAPGMMARVFIKHGYTPVVLIGGATGMVGDPKDDEERQLKSLDEIEKNKQGIKAQYKTIFNGLEFELVDNYDWFKNMGYLEFLREVGKKTSMSQMLDREFVKARTGDGNIGLSYAEFSYSLIQGYDFLHLSRHHDVSLQLCGADQWGNSVAGVDLIRRIDGKEAHVWSTPLVVNKSTGKKFGKSEEGAVWLDAKKTSAFKFYQFWLNLDDNGVEDYLKIYTLIEVAELDALMTEFKANPGDRAAQKYLAFEVTKLVHGEQQAKNVQNVSEVLFGQKQFEELSKTELEQLSQEIPTVKANDVVTALVKSGLASSNSEANRFVQSQAVAVNGVKLISDSDFANTKGNNGYKLIKRGKNSFVLLH